MNMHLPGFFFSVFHLIKSSFFRSTIEMTLLVFLQIFKEGKRRLLQLATPDALARVHCSKLHKEAEEYWEIYFNQQNHSSLNMFLEDFFRNENADNYSFLQVTCSCFLICIFVLIVFNLFSTFSCF